MKYKRIIIFVLLFSCNPIQKIPELRDEIKPYVAFIKKQHTSAKDYVINLFKKYDLVLLCERDHQDITQNIQFQQTISRLK